MNDAEKAYQYFVIAVPENEEQAKAYFWARKALQSTLTPPNEPLTQADVDKMHFDRVWIDYGVDDSGERCWEEGVVLYGKLYDIDTLDGSAFEDLLLDACDGETLDRPSGDYKVYRCQPNEPLTCDGCYWQTHGSIGKCVDCIREKTDNYRRPPEGEV